MENPRSLKLTQAARIYGLADSAIRTAIRNGELSVTLATSQLQGRKPYLLDSLEFEAWMHSQIPKPRASRPRHPRPSHGETDEKPRALDLQAASKISGLSPIAIWR